MWYWAKEVLTPEVLYNKMFLIKNNFGRTTWYMAEENGNVELFHKIWGVG
jgi:hypothetical protein